MQSIAIWKWRKENVRFREGDKERYGLELKFTDKFSFYLRYPAVLQIVTETGKLVVYKSGYEMVEKRGESFLCRTMIETDNGSSFLFSDQYEINNAVQEKKAIGQRNMMFSFRVSGTKRIKGS